MANVKRNRRARRKPEPIPGSVRECALWLMKEMLPHVRRARLPRTKSALHLRNATIEVLEAMRAMLDEAIDWLREGKTEPLKRIRVEG